MKRTLALFLTLSMLVTLCMTGCGKKEEAPAPETGGAPQEETVTITYLSRWANPSDPRSAYYMAKLDEFRKNNPNIIVDDISIGDDSEAHKAKVNSSIAAGNPPDLFLSLIHI